MSIAAINGNPVARARVQVSAWGAWWAELSLPDPIVLAGAVTITLADLTLRGTVVSGGVANGNAGYRIVAGAGGWNRDVPAAGYANDAGVKLANVVGDAAALVGETLADVPTTRLGPGFARSAGPASRVLHDVAPRAWRVEFDGVTRFGVRPTVVYTGDAARTLRDPMNSIVELATETIGVLVPGVVIDGAAPATDVEYVLDEKRLTVRVYAGRKSSRRLDALSRMIEALHPSLRWAGVFEFRVVLQSGDRFALQPVRVATGLPDLHNVPVRGPAGVKATVTPGELCLVAFVDRDPSRPVIVAHDAADAPGWMPLFLELGDAPRLGVARLTDAVIAGGFAGTITFASTRVKAGL